MKLNVTLSCQTRICKVTGGHFNPWSFNKQLNMMMDVGLLSTFKISEHNAEESFSTAKSPSVHQEVSHLSRHKKIRHCDHKSDNKSLSRAKSSKWLDFCITLTNPSITVTPSTKISYYSLVIFHQKLHFGNIDVRTNGAKQLANNFNLQLVLENLYSTNFSELFQKKRRGRGWKGIIWRRWVEIWWRRIWYRHIIKRGLVLYLLILCLTPFIRLMLILCLSFIHSFIHELSIE
jgi:hypothetical protein